MERMDYLASAFGLEQPVEDVLMMHRLRWLGHLGRMGTEKIPKMLLFGELEKKRSCHGMKKRWRDGSKSDLQAIGIGSRTKLIFVAQILH